MLWGGGGGGSKIEVFVVWAEGLGRFGARGRGFRVNTRA